MFVNVESQLLEGKEGTLIFGKQVGKQM